MFEIFENEIIPKSGNYVWTCFRNGNNIPVGHMNIEEIVQKNAYNNETIAAIHYLHVVGESEDIEKVKEFFINEAKKKFSCLIAELALNPELSVFYKKYGFVSMLSINMEKVSEEVLLWAEKDSVLGEEYKDVAEVTREQAKECAHLSAHQFDKE